MDLELEGKVALITGSTGGIGEAISLSLAKEKTKIIIHYYKKQKKAYSLKEKIDKIGIESFIVGGDISKIEDCKFITTESIKKFGKIDILVNTVAKWPKNDFLSATEEQWEETLNINLTSIFYMCKEAIPHMIRNGSGSIVNIGSECAWLGSTSGKADYAASKAGLVALSKTIAKQVAHFNIKVNIVAPGIVNTEMAKHDIKKKYDTYISRIPLRYIAHPDDIANTVMFLVSPKAKYITGSTIHVNGGMLML
jgi:3-oxoacyl-[acyl-carrier protein] reductase